MTKFPIGQVVRNPLQPGWGNGRITEIKGVERIRVLFSEVGPKLLDLNSVPLVSCPRNNETKYACDSSKIWEDRKCVPADPNSP